MIDNHDRFTDGDPEPSRLLSIAEAPGLFADAVLTDEGGNLLFLSLFGRDTAVKELVARLSLPANEGGLAGFRLERPVGYVRIAAAESVKQETGRVPSAIFGALSHLFLYDALAVAPDRASRRALLLHRPEMLASEASREALRERLWALVRETCHLPLLPHWREPVLERFEAAGWVKPLEGFQISAIAVDLGAETLDSTLSALITAGRLTLTA